MGRVCLGACILQARGDTGPLKKIQLHLAMNPSMAAFEAVKAARTPVVGSVLGARESFPQKLNQHHLLRARFGFAVGAWQLCIDIFLEHSNGKFSIWAATP